MESESGPDRLVIIKAFIPSSLAKGSRPAGLPLRRRWKAKIKKKVDVLEVESSRTESLLKTSTFAQKNLPCVLTLQRQQQDELPGAVDRSGNILHRYNRCSNRRCRPNR